MQHHTGKQRSRFQRGQALAEYMPLIPAAIMVLIGAGMVGRMLVQWFAHTVVVFDRYGLACEILEVDPPPASQDGSIVAYIDDHKIELKANVYDPATNTTTVTYRVTSGEQPSISHWTLGIPFEVYANIIEISEGQTTFVDPDHSNFEEHGLKFDKGYEGGGGGGGGNPHGGPPGQQGFNNGGIVLASFSSPVLTSTVQYDMEDYEGVARDIVILIDGEYNFYSGDVYVKAGPSTLSGTISMPYSIYDPNLDKEC
jgi:hypothetical protein